MGSASELCPPAVPDADSGEGGLATPVVAKVPDPADPMDVVERTEPPTDPADPADPMDPMDVVERTELGPDELTVVEEAVGNPDEASPDGDGAEASSAFSVEVSGVSRPVTVPQGALAGPVKELRRLIANATGCSPTAKLPMKVRTARKLLLRARDAERTRSAKGRASGRKCRKNDVSPLALKRLAQTLERTIGSLGALQTLLRASVANADNAPAGSPDGVEAA
tara:strand:- start:645 stop:1316 length:672 start_codon:yes stop_codon:yes gene_type:complete